MSELTCFSRYVKQCARRATDGFLAFGAHEPEPALKGKEGTGLQIVLLETSETESLLRLTDYYTVRRTSLKMPGTRDGTRTRMPKRGILSPLRLPIPPPGHSLMQI